MVEFTKLLLLSIPCGSISMAVSKSKIFQPFRRWVKSKSEFLWGGLSCPYCMSHWIAILLTAIYFPRPVYSRFVGIDFIISVMTMVSLASVTAFVVYYVYAAMSARDE
jgi:hypothetical protein